MWTKIKNFFTWRSDIWKMVAKIYDKVVLQKDKIDKYIPAIQYLENSLYFSGRIVAILDKDNNVINAGKCISMSTLLSDYDKSGFKIKYFIVLERTESSSEVITIEDNMTIKAL